LRFIDPTGMEPEEDEIYRKSVWDQLKDLFSIKLDFSSQKAIEQSVQRLEKNAETIQQAADAIHRTADVLSVANPIGSTVKTAVKLSHGEKVSGEDIAFSTMEMLPIAVIGKSTAKVAKGGKELYNFGKIAAQHMTEPGRRVPLQLLDDVIKTTKGLPDPEGSKALMHYSPMWKNGTQYNLEILYHQPTNAIWHFKYTQKALGPLPLIP